MCMKRKVGLVMMHKTDDPELMDALCVKKAFEALAYNLYEGIARKNLEKGILRQTGQLKNDYEYLTYKEVNVSSAYIKMGYSEIMFKFFNFSPMKKLYVKEIMMATFAKIICTSKETDRYSVVKLKEVLQNDLYSVYLKTVDNMLAGLDENGTLCQEYEADIGGYNYEAFVADYMETQKYYLN